jgi:hypothetical protein
VAVSADTKLFEHTFFETLRRTGFKRDPLDKLKRKKHPFNVADPFRKLHEKHSERKKKESDL